VDVRRIPIGSCGGNFSVKVSMDPLPGRENSEMAGGWFYKTGLAGDRTE